ncbi:MAG: hypothetical protein SFT90_02765 [Rickettsiales bacterium]|nr:hypothetical protein [Rickettsiales bacterium]
MGFEYRRMRLADFLDNYFKDLKEKANSEIAAEEQIVFSAIEKVAGDCFLLKAEEPYRFSYLGENLLKVVRDEKFDTPFTGMILPSNHKMARKFSDVIEKKKELTDEGEFESSIYSVVKYRQKLFPLTARKGDNEVKYIFGGMRWKEEEF